MKTFLNYLDEAAGGKLSIYDMDDTIIRSPHIQVHVKDKDGNRVGSLSTHDFADHTLEPGQSYDFAEFKKARNLRQSTPIPNMIRHINHAQQVANRSPNHKVAIVTARSDFDSGPQTIQALKRLGVKDMDNIHLHRAGNIPGNMPDADKKLVHIRKYLDTGKYKQAHMYDDSKRNLNAFHTLRKEYPHVAFSAYHIDEAGKPSRYEPSDK